MAFTNNFRIEHVYFERLKTLIEVLKSYKDNVVEEPARTMIENAIDVDGAVLLLYRNLGEAWAELADLIQKTQKLLQDLDDKTEAYHDELNERIDEVNNYLMALIRALETRVDAIEADLQQMGRLFTYDLNRVNDEYTLSESGTPVTFESTAELFSHTRPHLVTVRGNVNGETTYFFPREYDSDTTDGLFEWYSFGFVGNEIHEITVTLLPDDSVNVAVETTDFTTILSRIGSLETRMTAAEGDIDNLELNKQDKLTAGQNITIDGNNVISATGGSNVVAGTGINISQTAQGQRISNAHTYRGTYKMSVPLLNDRVNSENYFTEARLFIDPTEDLAYIHDSTALLNNNNIVENPIEVLSNTSYGYVQNNYYLSKALGQYYYVDLSSYFPFAVRMKNGVSQLTIPNYSASKDIKMKLVTFSHWFLEYTDDDTQPVIRDLKDLYEENEFYISSNGTVKCPELLTGMATQKPEKNVDLWIDSLLHHFVNYVNEYFSEPLLNVSLGCKISFEALNGEILDISNDTDVSNNLANILTIIKAGNYYLDVQI